MLKPLRLSIPSCCCLSAAPPQFLVNSHRPLIALSLGPACVVNWLAPLKEFFARQASLKGTADSKR